MTALLNTPECVSAQNQPVQFGIVAKNRLAVARAAHIKFESIRAMVQGEVKCSQGIFRRVMARAAMSEK